MSDVLATGRLSLHDTFETEVDAPGYERQPIELVERPGNSKLPVMNRSRISFGEMGERIKIESFGLWVDGVEVAHTLAHRSAIVQPDTEVVIREGDVAFAYTPE